MQPTGFKLLPDVVKNLLIINGLCFLATIIFSSTFGFSLVRELGLYQPNSGNFAPYQVVSHLFMHGGFFHILINMFVLWMFGSVLENILGGKRFFIYYFVAGLGAAALYTSVNYLTNISIYNDLLQAGVSGSLLDQLSNATTKEEFQSILYSVDNLTPAIRENMQSLYYSYNIPTVGASGAVYGLLAAFGLLFPNTPIYLYFLFPIKAKYFVIGITVIELYSEITGGPNDNIAHLAHLGGMLFGFLLLKAWNIQRIN